MDVFRLELVTERNYGITAIPGEKRGFFFARRNWLRSFFRLFGKCRSERFARFLLYVLRTATLVCVPDVARHARGAGLADHVLFLAELVGLLD